VSGNWRERITVDPAVLAVKPVVRGTRIAVEHVLCLFADGWTLEQVLASGPGLSVEDVRASFGCARDAVAEGLTELASIR
jgi:uncharacterized protein (DUF433 family)